MNQYIDRMSGYEFEEFCTNVLQATGFYNVKRTKLSGDFGVDIIAERNGHKIGIQCKRYSSSVGVKAVQEAVSGSIYYKCDYSMVISNKKFTQQAIDMSRKTNTILMNIDDLIRMAKNKEKVCSFFSPSEEDVRELSNQIFKAFLINNIALFIDECFIGRNETFYYAKKEDNVKINSVFSAKKDVSFFLKKNFNMTVDYEKQRIVLAFDNEDIYGFSGKNMHENLEEDNHQNRDRFFEKAGKLAIENNKISIGMLQRYFQIGFNRAEKIMQQLYDFGVIEEKGEDTYRKVLMNESQFDKVIKDESTDEKKNYEEQKQRENQIFSEEKAREKARLEALSEQRNLDLKRRKGETQRAANKFISLTKKMLLWGITMFCLLTSIGSFGVSSEEGARYIMTGIFFLLFAIMACPIITEKTQHIDALKLYYKFKIVIAVALVILWIALL